MIIRALLGVSDSPATFAAATLAALGLIIVTGMVL